MIDASITCDLKGMIDASPVILKNCDPELDQLTIGSRCTEITICKHIQSRRHSNLVRASRSYSFPVSFYIQVSQAEFEQTSSSHFGVATERELTDTMSHKSFVVVLLLASCLVSCFGADQDEQYCSADIVFLMDSSGSVDPADFYKGLGFVGSIVQSLKIGAYDNQIGLIVFDSEIFPQFNLNDYSNKQDVLTRVASTEYTGHLTRTDLALDYAAATSFTTASGTRSTAAQIVVVITDGQSNEPNKTVLAAQRVRDKGVTVFSIGVGSGIDIVELKAIASDPDSSHVFLVDGYNALQKILAQVEKSACKAKPRFLCSGQADIVFLLDDSSSVGLANFYKMLQFVVDVAQEFIVGPDDIQIGVDTSSGQFAHEFFLNNATDKIELQKLVSSISYTGGETNIADAVQRMRLDSFTSSTGHRPDVPNIAIVMTDGKSNYTASASSVSSNDPRDEIAMFAIGIGPDADIKELKSITTSSYSHNIRFSSAFDALPGLVDFTAAQVCSEIEKTSDPVCGPKADIIFLIDSSGSVGQDNFQLLLTFVSNFVSDLKVGTNNIRIGVAKFNSRPFNEFHLNKYNNKRELIDAIKNIKYSSRGGTNTASAIKYMGKTMFMTANGNRPGIPNIAIVITDGNSNRPEETKAAADRAKAKGIIIFSVGVGDDVSRSELNGIASDPNNRHVITVKDFSKLNAIRTAFKVQTCEDIQKILPTIPPSILPITKRSVTTPSAPTLRTELCEDTIPNCAAYGQSVCNNYQNWANTFCARTCGICNVTITVEPPCVNKFNQCNVKRCAGYYKPSAKENCRKFCGYCSPGTQVDISLNKCFYKGQQYDQGDQWNDGCAYECECADASTGQYECYNKCPSYYNLPKQCSLVKQQGKCCLEPVCTFDLTYDTKNESKSCFYKGETYDSGQIWYIGCQFQCICLGDASYVCQSQCPHYASLPSNCKLVRRPGECCEKPLCEFQTQVGVLTGSGGTSGPASIKADSAQSNVCINNGVVRQQNEVWYDGCEKRCICENATLGYVACENRCPDFLNLPKGCSLVRVPKTCCRLVVCDSPATFTSSQTTRDTVGDVLQVAPQPHTDLYPTLPPGETYAPGQNPKMTTVAPTTPSQVEEDIIKPPSLTAGAVEEGTPATITCAADLSSCPHTFLMKWTEDSRELASCTYETCGGSFKKLYGIDVKMVETGSILTLQNMTRVSPLLHSQWGCEFCGGSQLGISGFVIYVKPVNPKCSLIEDLDPESGKVKAVTVTCSTKRIFPAAKCSFERRTDGGEPVIITTSYDTKHIPTSEEPVYFKSRCSVTVSAEQLGEGRHTFNGYMYPDIPDGKTLANYLVIEESVNIKRKEDKESGQAGRPSSVYSICLSILLILFVTKSQG
ncbi:hypothetical protein RRG08_015474 [Elysia crispata]|uniref:Uncharacterized protein n=1 Tax=Elysia crispata TaxID=231223 RepID=A0AAE1A3I6_9GAST|nr:hypothetical protein RRG08_015474 [Elysia crispata]